MAQKKMASIITLSSVPFLMVLGNSMLIPEFPKIKSVLGISQFQVGLLITLFSASAAVTILFLGYISDRIGRKKIIIPALLCYGLGGAIAGTAAIIFENPYPVILGSRIVQGVGAAGTGPLAIALAGDLFKTKERSEAMGVLEAANGIGKVLSPVLGAAIALIAWYALFFSYAALSLPIAAAVWFFVSEPQAKGSPEPFAQYLQRIKKIFDKKGVSLLFTFLGGIVVLFILFGTLSYISDILEQKFTLHSLARGAILSVPLLFMSSFSYLTGWLLKKKGKHYKLSLVIGLVIVTIALIILPFCNTVWVYPLTLALLGLGSGFTLPALNTLVTSATANEQRGGVTSIYGSVRFTGVALGPPTFTLLAEISEKVMFFANAGLTAASAVLIFLFLKEKILLPDKETNPKSEI
ncbi:MAG: MFS transporter [Dethiobacteria bacterium]